MSLVKYCVPLVIFIFAYYAIKLYDCDLFKPHQLNITLNNECWRVCEKKDTGIRPFKVYFSNDTIQDLKRRLTNHRPLTPPLEGIGQEYGTNSLLVKKVIDFWNTKYDFKKRENFLNTLPQFQTTIQGLDIHYIHVKPSVKKDSYVKVLPLLILHGWPGSVREFYEIIPMLTTVQKGKNFVFEVIAPSIPGYGFSSAATKTGLGPPQIAEVLKNLMKRLGFQQFYIQGGDFGAIILQHMSFLYPKTVLGFHSNMCTVSDAKSILKLVIGSIFYPSWLVKPDHFRLVYPLQTNILEKLVTESGYLHLQASKPDTLGAALTDSPTGLVAYFIEKFVTGANFTAHSKPDGDFEKYYTYTEFLDNVMIYWISNSVTTSFRLYAETFNKAVWGMDAARPVMVPTACARFENDFYAPDGLIPDIYPNLVQLTDYLGGHFAALQLPEVLAKDIFEGVEKFRAFHVKNERLTDV